MATLAMACGGRSRPPEHAPTAPETPPPTEEPRPPETEPADPGPPVSAPEAPAPATLPALRDGAPSEPLLAPYQRVMQRTTIARAPAPGLGHAAALEAWDAHRMDPRALPPRAFLAAYCLDLELGDAGDAYFEVFEGVGSAPRTLRDRADALGAVGERWLARLRARHLVALDTCLRSVGARLVATAFVAPDAAEVARLLRAGAVAEDEEGVVVTRGGGGYRAGDRLVALDRTRIRTLADVGWALRGREERSRVSIRYRRQVSGETRRGERVQWLDPPAGPARVRFAIEPGEEPGRDPLALPSSARP
ncbi:MAG: hypothetical protein AAGH15_08225 [Myxococcota bacterium]